MNRRRLLLLAAVLAAAACRGPAPAGPLAGSGVGGPFAMTDQDGRAVTDRTFAGRWRLMYFGYTFCPDVCPVDVQKIAQGMKRFTSDDPARAAKVVPIFVTVDPERDTPPVLKTFVRAFSPDDGRPDRHACASRGDAQRVFRIYAAKSGTGRDYLVDHSATIYLMDPANRPVSRSSTTARRRSADRGGAQRPMSAKPFWETTPLDGDDPRPVGEPVRRLRPLLRPQARGRGDRRAVPDQRRLPTARRGDGAVQGLPQPQGARPRMRSPDARPSSTRSTGCRRAAPTSASTAGRGWPTGTRLVSGDPDTVHRAGISVRGWTISEDVAGDLENHIIDEPL